MTFSSRLRAYGVFACCTAVWFLVGGLPLSGQVPMATIEPSWNSAFENERGWVGGDGAGTVDLGDGRILWMFGDSLIGGVENAKYVAGTHMVNNALGVSRKNSDGSIEIEFGWGEADAGGKPTAWLTPDPDCVRGSGGSMHKDYPHGWYWPAGGGCLVQTEQGKRLIVFLFHVGRTLEDRGVWSFKSVGGAMAVIENFDRPFSQWNVQQLDLPFTVDSDQVLHDPKLREISWGMSCLSVDEMEQGEKVQRVYIYGNRVSQDSRKRQVLVARVPASRIADFSQWRFYSTEAGETRWSPDAGDAQPVAENGLPEFSVESLKVEGVRKYLMVQSDPTLGPNIDVRVSDSPEGPWSKGQRVYRVPELVRSKNYFAYAAKGHLAASPPGKLLITYVVNSTDFWEMLGDPAIYRPRCIVVSLRDLLGPDPESRDP